MAQTLTCPRCGREIPVRQNRFGDLIFNHHKMAVIGVSKVLPEIGVEFDWQPNVNPYAEPLWKIDCPMSGQPVEE